MIWKKIAITLFLFAAMTGCSLANKLVYRIDINQGNYVEKAAVKQLRFGMSKEQVQYLLGTPMLIEPGYPDTWYFIQRQQSGHKKPKQKSLIVDFDSLGKVKALRGDIKADEKFFEPLQ
ncbi:MAG: outer membrane protein assembly factor BamE [Enterovibrio sp.]